MPYKDPDKHRQAAKLSTRKRRAEEKLNALKGKTSAKKTKAADVVKTVTETVSGSANIDPTTLKGVDEKVLRFGLAAIDKAMAALEFITPDKLDPIDVKRLGEFGILLVRAAQESLEGAHKKEESVEVENFQTEVQRNPEALSHVHAILKLAAANELNKPAPDKPRNLEKASGQ